MPTSITTINGTDVISTSRTDINNNFSSLNTNKIETSTLDTDTTLTANSDSKIATQKAVKTFVEANVNPTGRSWNEYAVDAVGTDAYGITVAGFTTYTAGQTFKFKAGTANTGACSLNVNAVGAKTIKKDVSSDLVTGDILANQIVVVTYDGTNFQMIANPPSTVVPVVRLYTQSKTIPSGTTRFDITNPSGTTFRYTYDGTGTDPGITAITYPVNAKIEVQVENMSTGNNGSFTITGSGNNYFEVTNASGVVEADKTIGGANSYIALSQTWTKPTGLKYVVVELVGGGGSGTANGGGGGGGYSKKTISESSLGSTEPVLPSGGGATVSGGLQVAGFTSFFGTHLSATGGAVGATGGGTGGIGSNGDINIAGTAGGGDATAPGGSSFFGGGAPDGVAGRPYGGGAGAGAFAGGNGVVMLTEYYG